MKILQINCVYKKGSTGKIVWDIHNGLLKRGFDSVVCYGRGQPAEGNNVYKTCWELCSKFNHLISKFTGIIYGGCVFSTNKLIRIIKKENPDIVHLHCLNGYFVNIYRLITWLKKKHVKTVLTLHAEFMYTANCGHAFECKGYMSGCGNCPSWKQETGSFFFNMTAFSWKRMKKAFEGFDSLLVASVSPWLMTRAIAAPILKDFKHYVVLNGLDTSIFHPYESKEMKERMGIGNKKIIFHATAHFSDSVNDIKGGHYIIELAKRLPDIIFLVAGVHDGIKDCPKNIILLGQVNNQQELARYYSMADLTVITSKRETFSMVTAESLCCATPVVGFHAGGPESIAINDYCDFVEFGKIEDLCNVVLNRLNNPISIDRDLTFKFYSKETMISKYHHLYKKFGVTNECEI